jgi:hypothetical protein
MGFRLYESAGYLGPHPTFADSSDFDTLRRWAVSHNDWKRVKNRRGHRVRRGSRLVCVPERHRTRGQQHARTIGWTVTSGETDRKAGGPFNGAASQL